MASVTVVIPTYNAARFIRETLGSVFAQNQLPCEVIVVDDCSTDTTVGIVEQLAASSPVPLRLFRMPKNTGGPAEPLNVGIEAARGEYIAPLDQDDRWMSDNLRVKLDAHQLCPDAGLVYSGIFFQVESGSDHAMLNDWYESVNSTIPKQKISEGFFRLESTDAVAALQRHRSFVSSCSNMFFRRAVWVECGGFDAAAGLSTDFAYLLMVSVRYDLVYVCKQSVLRRIHDSSLYRSSNRLEQILKIMYVLSVGANVSTSHVQRAAFKAELRRFALDSAYRFRAEGKHADSIHCLQYAMRLSYPWRSAVLAWVKSVALRIFHPIAANRVLES